MQKSFSIYKTDSFQVRTPIGLREVNVHKKVGELSEEVPDQIAAEIDKIWHFNADLVVEGTGQILVQTPQGVYPQPITFVFDLDVQDAKTAYARFNEHMEKELNRLRAEQKKESIVKASEGDLKAIDRMAAKSGLIVP
jgi:hypothetical protein